MTGGVDERITLS